MLKGPDDLESILEGQCPTCQRNLLAGLCSVCEIRWSASVAGDQSRFTACREVDGLGVDLMEWIHMPMRLLDGVKF